MGDVATLTRITVDLWADYWLLFTKFEDEESPLLELIALELVILTWNLVILTGLYMDTV